MLPGGHLLCCCQVQIQDNSITSPAGRGAVARRRLTLTPGLDTLASITHHTHSPRVRLRCPPRARPLPAPVLRHPSRPTELRQSARPPVFAVRCPTIAHHPPRARHTPQARPQLTRPPLLGHRPPPGASSATSATSDACAAPSPTASVAAAHPVAAARPPLPAPMLCRPPRPPELRQSARPFVLAARCPTIGRHLPPARLPPRARPQLTRPPLLGHRPPPGAPPATSVTPDARAAPSPDMSAAISSPGRRCSAAAGHPGAAPPAAPAGATPVRSSARPRTTLLDHRPPPAASAAAAHPAALLGHRPPPGASSATSAMLDAGARVARPSPCSVRPSS
ncbi:basic proline-rich protein-like [Sorghum bicolor]|uniref:basic proline-rich protein-like n=1 Tax=Sorghum bicolor TaxID=4558 RepID=UPI000B42614B|nr:basic proline-rich protein-like [Sorghum bicolor]|eukprot:XP_021315235.1 basic proline-rich protein-like [Sorghum bicolor]